MKTTKSLWNFVSCVSHEERKEKGSIYFITINKHVKKIGCTTIPLKNCAGYGVGNSGSPSTRTTGIHYNIAKHLLQENDVSFYASMTPKIKNISFKNLLGENKQLQNVYIDPKIIEKHYLFDYKRIFGNIPDWNIKEHEKFKMWHNDINRINHALRNKKIIHYKESHEKSPYLRLYHWKYNDIPLSSKL